MELTVMITNPIIPTCKGVVVFEEARRASNWRNQMTLDEFLKAKKIPGISGIDTRALTKIIRKHGTMRANLDPCWGQYGPCDGSAPSNSFADRQYQAGFY